MVHHHDVVLDDLTLPAYFWGLIFLGRGLLPFLERHLLLMVRSFTLSNLGLFSFQLLCNVAMRCLYGLLLSLQLHGFTYSRYARSLGGLGLRKTVKEAVRVVDHKLGLLLFLRLGSNVVFLEDGVLWSNMFE